MFWENTNHKGEGVKSLKRATSIIKLAQDIPEDQWDHREMDRYGLGDVRSPELFYEIFLIDPIKRTSHDLCPFITNGVMHNDFQPYLRSDGLGIDYTFISGYNTKEVLEKNLGKEYPYWERKIMRAQLEKNRDELKNAIDEAEALHLTDKNNRGLIRKAKAKLSTM